MLSINPSDIPYRNYCDLYLEMNPEISVIELFHLFAAAQGAFLGLLFLIQKRGNRLANRFLGFLLLVFSFRLFGAVVFWSRHLIEFPHLSLVTFPFIYLVGVLFYFYSRHLSANNLKLNSRFLLHLIPFFVAFVYILPYYLLPADLKVQIVKASYNSGASNLGEMPIARLIVYAGQFPHVLIYIGFAVRNLTTSSSIPLVSNAKVTVQRQWLRVLTIGFGSFFSLWILYNVCLITGMVYQKEVDQVLTTIMAVLIYAMAYYLFRKPELYLQDVAENGSKYKTSTLTTSQARDYLEKLHEIMEQEQLYRNSELKLSELAEKVGISGHHLSQIINENLGQNFFDFINGYRIKEAKNLLSDPDSKKFTLLSIAHTVGFNNKTSFNNFFKKQTGMTPSEFQKREDTV